jgi:putative flavoprotein involved in K+ transport
MMHWDGYWRDLLTFGSDFTTRHGIDEIQGWLASCLNSSAARNFRIEGEVAIGAIGEYRETLEFFFTFETSISNGRGFGRLVPGPDSPDDAKIFTILTSMKELKDFPEATGRKRRREDLRVSSHGLENWLDQRNAERDFRHRDPEVIIIGAGQSGLMMGARLGQLNVSTLIVEKSERIGDVWRNRYRTLKLHNESRSRTRGPCTFPRTSWRIGSSSMPKAWSSTFGPAPRSWAVSSTTRTSDGRCGCVRETAARASCGQAMSSWRSA